MKTVGIDHGANGGIAVLDEQGGIIRTRRIGVELPSILAALAETMPVDEGPYRVFLERPSDVIRFAKTADPLTTGKVQRCAGRIEGALAMMGYPPELVHVSTWQAAMHKGLPKSLGRKERSIRAVALRWPREWRDHMFPGNCKRPHDGIAEALLLAEYGRAGEVLQSRLEFRS